MEKKSTGNTSKHILLTIMGVLTLAEIILRLCIITTNTFSGVVMIVSMLFVALYCFFLYKKPHGNTLKYAMLLFALSSILSSISYLMKAAHYSGAITILVSAAICYGAGRLNRIDQNRILFPIIDIILLGQNIWTVTHFNSNGAIGAFSFFNYFIAFTTLMIAYFVRFKEHKEAGLADKN